MTKSSRLMNMSTGDLLATEMKFLDVNRRETALAAPTDFTGIQIQPSSG